MDLATRAVRGGAWYAGLRSLGQLASWIVTILVARQLSPEAYGLMEAATILTGVVEVFSELGLGASLVQRRSVTSETLSSIFWVSLVTGAALAIVGVGLAYPTAWLLAEPALIPVTQYASLSFFVGAFSVVPMNLLMREQRFKAIGITQLVATIAGSATTLTLAYAGAGVWALATGMLAVRTATSLGAFAASGWRPRLTLDLAAVRPHLGFGAQVAASRLLYYALQKSDRAIVSRLLGMEALGYYAFARGLASLPNDKIVAVVNQVLFPILSRLHENPDALTRAYRQTVRHLALLTFPVFLLGAAFGETFVAVVLGPRWEPAGFLFRVFCLAQLVVSITSLNTTVVNAIGRPGLVAKVGVVNLAVMVVSIYLAARAGLNYLVVPWVCVYAGISIVFAMVTTRVIGVDFGSLVRSLLSPVVGAVASVVVAGAVHMALSGLGWLQPGGWTALIAALSAGGLTYALYLWWAERDAIRALAGRFVDTKTPSLGTQAPLVRAAERS